MRWQALQSRQSQSDNKGTQCSHQGHAVCDPHTGGTELLEKEMKRERQFYIWPKLLIVAIVNTFYSKRREHILTYKSGGNATVVEYFMVRRENLRELKNCKMIPGNTAWDAGNGDEDCQEKDESKRNN